MKNTSIQQSLLPFKNKEKHIEISENVKVFLKKIEQLRGLKIHMDIDNPDCLN